MTTEDATITVRLTYIECPLCGKKFFCDDKEYLDMQYRVHLDYDCKCMRLLKALPKGSTMGDVHYLLTGKYPKGYKPRKDKKPCHHPPKP